MGSRTSNRDGCWRRALILVAADRAGITGAKAFAVARTTHQEFYYTGSRGGYRGH
jgi:hypothetical protein